MYSNIHHHQKSYCTSNSFVCSKPLPHDVPKQLLPLRSQAVIPQQVHSHHHHLTRSIWDSTPTPYEGTPFSFPPSQQRAKIHKQQLAYIEKDKRACQMIPVPQHQYHAYDRPVHYQNTRKMTPSGQAMLMRTPSSGFSSASSSENMFSGLSLNDNDQKLNELMMDPAAEVDLDIFLLPESRYKQQQPSASTSRANLSQISQNGGAGGAANLRQIAPSQAKSTVQTPFSDLSYQNIKRSSGYIDYMPPSTFTTTTSTSIAQPPTSSVPANSYARCTYCWKTYVELCQRVAKMDPVIPCDGPWRWHSLYDAAGQVSCPRLWFAQIDRVGSDMIQQMTRHAPV